MEKLKLAIVGTGHFANVHLDNYLDMPDVEIVGILGGQNRERTEDFASRAGARPYFDYEQMIHESGCTAVAIVSPDTFHKEQAIVALRAGINVLCEKPLALTYADTQEMEEVANKSGAVNMVNFSLRQQPVIAKAKTLIDNGVIGELRYFEANFLQSWLVSQKRGDWRTDSKWLWRLSKEHGGFGALHDVGCHILDTVSMLTGDITQVYCKLPVYHKADGDKIGEYKLDANDSSLIMATTNNGTVGNISISRWATGNINAINIRLSGTKGALRIGFDTYFDGACLELCVGTNNIDEAIWEQVYCESVDSLYRQFVDSAKARRHHVPDFRRGSYIQGLLEACNISNKENREVEV
ncbi:MAG: Gfo/Idh/MocA family protein [Bacteroidales bacterium]